MAPSHRAQLSPLQAETVWSLEGGFLCEDRAGRQRRFELAALKSLKTGPAGAVLIFQRGRIVLPALSFGHGLRPQDRRASFNAFVGAVAAEAARQSPSYRQQSTTPAYGEPVWWVMGLMAMGSLALLALSGFAGAWSLGLALACRLVFVMILAAGLLPWLDRPAQDDRKLNW